MRSPDHLPHDRVCIPSASPDGAGRTCLITFHTFERAPIFKDWTLAASMARASMSPHVLRASRLLCWVLMPDHWQGLVELGGMDALPPLIGRIKSVSARAVNANRAQAGQVWDAGFHDQAVYGEGIILDKARHLVMSPVRAGLVERIGLYPFWDALWLDGKRCD